MAGELFLLGGGDAALVSAIPELVASAGGSSARIALLLQGGARTQLFMNKYTKPLQQSGVQEILVVSGDEQGRLDREQARRALTTCSGIFIGGGNTPTYVDLYCSEGIAEVIRQRYRDGVPVGGMSAGALMIPQHCAIPPEDTGRDTVWVRPGLGLVANLIVGVHFSEWQALPHVLLAMSQTETALGLGLDEAGCAVFRGGVLDRTIGAGVYLVEMRDFRRLEYVLRKVA